jgi:hypothetical protein
MFSDLKYTGSVMGMVSPDPFKYSVAIMERLPVDIGSCVGGFLELAV